MTLKYLALYQSEWNNKNAAEKPESSGLQKFSPVLNRTCHVTTAEDPQFQENSSVQQLGKIKELMAGLEPTNVYKSNCFICYWT